MDEQTTPKKVRRVGSIAFALVLIAAGVLLIVYQFVPQFDLLKILKFSPVILIALGIEMLVYCARPDVKVKFDWLAMLGTAFTLCIVGTAALLPLAISEWGPARSYAQSRIESQKNRGHVQRPEHRAGAESQNKLPERECLVQPRDPRQLHAAGRRRLHPGTRSW